MEEGGKSFRLVLPSGDMHERRAARISSCSKKKIDIRHSRLLPPARSTQSKTSKCDAAQGKARSVVLLLLCQGEAATRRAGDGNRSLAASTGDRKTFGDPLSGKKKNVVGIPGTAALAVTPSAFNRSVL